MLHIKERLSSDSQKGVQWIETHSSIISTRLKISQYGSFRLGGLKNLMGLKKINVNFLSYDLIFP